MRDDIRSLCLAESGRHHGRGRWRWGVQSAAVALAMAMGDFVLTAGEQTKAKPAGS